MNIFRHAAFVAADVDVGAAFDPVPQGFGLFEYAVLDVDFMSLIARECEVDAGENPVVVPLLPFGLIEKIFGEVGVAEEEPVVAGCVGGGAFLQEGAEGGDAGSGADHDDGRFGVLRKAEMITGFDVYGDVGAGLELAEVAGGAAEVVESVGFVFDNADGEMNFFFDFGLGGGDGVEAGGEFAKGADEGVGGEGGGVFVDDVDDLPVGNVGLQGCGVGGDGS